MPPELHFDVASLDYSNVIADLDAIRKVNPQRFEMEQLDAIVMLDLTNKIIVGYKDVRYDEFWCAWPHAGLSAHAGRIDVRGVGPALQLLHDEVQRVRGGLPSAFPAWKTCVSAVRSGRGDRLVLVAKQLKFNRRQMLSNVQAFVKDVMVFHGDIIGVPLKRGEG